MDPLYEPDHAQLIPIPAAVVSDKVCCRLVQHLVLLVNDLLLLLEGTNDRFTAHALMEVAVDWRPESCADLVKLIICIGVRLGDLLTQIDHHAEHGDKDMPISNGEHH